MYASIIICLLSTKVIAQFDGEFWWMNPKLNKYRAQPAQPKFEDLSEFDTDESAKIIFRDEDLLNEKFEDLKIDKVKNDVESDKQQSSISFQDKSQIVWPDEIKQAVNVNSTNDLQNKKEESCNETDNTDVLGFKFPDDNFFDWEDKKEKNSTNKNLTINMNQNNAKITFIKSKVPIKVHKEDPKETESICTFMKKTECNRQGGANYIKHHNGAKRPFSDSPLICCILPMQHELILSKIYFLDDLTSSRFKRSNKDGVTNAAQSQRNTLLQRKFSSQAHRTKVTTPNPSKHKIVTPSDEYIDPYWNIKGPSSKKRKENGAFQQTSTRYDYDSDEYIEDYEYTVELPSPGLVGLYSDHGASKPGWTYPNPGVYGGVQSEEDDTPTFGYGPTVDPRLENHVVTQKPRIIGRPVKLSTSSDERKYNAESQTISYQSNPDFQVLQGFKLLNLVRNKSRIFRNGRKTTTERIFDEDSKEKVLTASIETEYDGNLFDKNEYSNKECGKIVTNLKREYDNDKQIGEASRGSQPWVAIVVLTKRRQSVLCYATIIHPKAAITAADCVYGRTSPGEITLIAGAWQLSEESREHWQKRMASSQYHSQYQPGDLAHNLALLYWKRPLVFNAEVQPACLSEPKVGDDCIFFGWGGFDQEFRQQPRWQRTSILSQKICSDRIASKRVPKDAFCAAVRSRGTVTGVGGPLICKVGSRRAVAGVAVWREHAVVLIPAREWAEGKLAQLELN